MNAFFEPIETGVVLSQPERWWLISFEFFGRMRWCCTALCKLNFQSGVVIVYNVHAAPEMFVKPLYKSFSECLNFVYIEILKLLHFCLNHHFIFYCFEKKKALKEKYDMVFYPVKLFFYVIL